MFTFQNRLLNYSFVPFFLFLLPWSHMVSAQNLNQKPVQIWRCGKLVTNQIPENKEEGAKSECHSINPPVFSVTLEGPKSQLKSPSLSQGPEPSLGKEKVNSSEGQNPLPSKSLRDEQSKQILTSERDRLKERQNTLDGLLGGAKLSEAEVLKLSSEKERNAGDLKGLEREISKFH
jgi:hypothetical protein